VIVVAGEALMDLIVSPSGTLQARPGGGPYNAARTLGLLGAQCTYLGVLADDYFGVQLRNRLLESNVRIGCASVTNAPSTLAVAQLSEDGSASYRFYLEGTSLPMLSAKEAWAGLPESYAALHVGTLGLVVEPTASVLETLVDHAATDHLIMLDPNCRPAVVTDRDAFRARMLRMIRQADLIKVSEDDVTFLFPEGGFDEVIDKAVARGAIVLHTAGADPIDVYAHDGRTQVMPAQGDIVDTVGAGDIFGATVLWALLEQGWGKGQRWGVDQVAPAVRTGATAAHIACQRAGAEPPTLDELTATLTAAT
jgi:fructokinase